jgi:hypothetical protein
VERLQKPQLGEHDGDINSSRAASSPVSLHLLSHQPGTQDARQLLAVWEQQQQATTKQAPSMAFKPAASRELGEIARQKDSQNPTPASAATTPTTTAESNSTTAAAAAAINTTLQHQLAAAAAWAVQAVARLDPAQAQERVGAAVAAGVRALLTASVSMRSDAAHRRRATRRLEAHVAALQAQTQALTAELEEQRARVAFLESQVSMQQPRLDKGRAMHAVDRAVQHFRRHITALPGGVRPEDSFYEREQDVIGKGGCAVVYAWRGAPLPAGDCSIRTEADAHAGFNSGVTAATSGGVEEWAVKVDPISYRYAHAGTFEPERCADLLPAFLPPHPNILSPKAWWVGTLPRPTPSTPPTAPAAAAAVDAALAVSSHASRGGGKHGSAASSAQLVSTQRRSSSGYTWGGYTSAASGGATGFKLFTLYDRYPRSLSEHLQQQQKRVASTVEGGGGEATTEKGALPLDLRSLLVVVRDVAAALAHLEQHRVIHCDVKPENVLVKLEEGGSGDAGRQRVARAVLIDFGLARLLPPGVRQLDARGGTWMCKAPEQMNGPPGLALAGQERSESPVVCGSTDVWALGMVICQLCAGGPLPSHRGLPFGLSAQQVRH